MVRLFYQVSGVEVKVARCGPGGWVVSIVCWIYRCHSTWGCVGAIMRWACVAWMFGVRDACFDAEDRVIIFLQSSDHVLTGNFSCLGTYLHSPISIHRLSLHKDTIWIKQHATDYPFITDLALPGECPRYIWYQRPNWVCEYPIFPFKMLFEPT